MDLSYANDKLKGAVDYLIGKEDIKTRLLNAYLKEFSHVFSDHFGEAKDLDGRLTEVKKFFKKERQEPNEDNVRNNLDELDPDTIEHISLELLYILLELNKKIGENIHE